jgi:magnesium chelatase family protein
MLAMDVVPRDSVEDALVLGELTLDGAIHPVSGILPAEIAAVAAGDDRVGRAALAESLDYRAMPLFA